MKKSTINIQEHIPNNRIQERAKSGPHLIKHEAVGFNGRLAVLITSVVGTMWCAYFFTIIALISLPMAIEGGTAPLIEWITQTFLQLVLLSVIMVGQKVAATASDKQAEQTYKDTEAILKLQDEIYRLMKINNALMEEVRTTVLEKKKQKSSV